MPLGKGHHERNTAQSLQEVRRLLNDALGQLNLCEDVYLGMGDADWEKVARLADKAFITVQASILPLGMVGTCALRRVALEWGAGFEVNIPPTSEPNLSTVTPHPQCPFG